MKKLGSGLRAPQEQSARRLFSEASFLAFRCLFELEPGPGPRRGGGEEHFGSTFVKAGFLWLHSCPGPGPKYPPSFSFLRGRRAENEGRRASLKALEIDPPSCRLQPLAQLVGELWWPVVFS